MVIFLALLSPLHILSDGYLFSAHMLQHVLLTLVAPPLLILGTPDWLLRRLMRPDIIFILVRRATHPVVAFVAFNGVFSIWHMPALYNVSMTNHGVHIGEHLLFIGAAIPALVASRKHHARAAAADVPVADGLPVHAVHRADHRVRAHYVSRATRYTIGMSRRLRSGRWTP